MHGITYEENGEKMVAADGEITINASMNEKENRSVDMSLEERWRAVEPYWEAMRNTAYAKVTLLTAKVLFGIDDLNKNTYQNLSLAIAESRQPGWYRHVMKEKAEGYMGENDAILLASRMLRDNPAALFNLSFNR